MRDMPHVWLRKEARPTERRAPITPEAAGELVRAGFLVTVEEAPQRVFPVAAYATEGCAVAPGGSWVDAPGDAYVLGLKELPPEPGALRHRHVLFGHAYKGQHGARELLERFAAGGGTLLDLEYLVDERGRRLTSFGYWAGYVGAALAVLHRAGALAAPLRPTTAAELEHALRAAAQADPSGDRALVVGALGRAGRGALAALAVAGTPTTAWDIAETAQLDSDHLTAGLLGHDVLVNAAFSDEPGRPFVTRADLDRPDRRLAVIADVSCDVNSACNLLPIYDEPTSWEHPVLRVAGEPRPVDLIAIDNLPSLVPAEASAAFSADLLPLLLDLDGPGEAWRRCRERFLEARAGLLGAAPEEADRA
ncbi:MAG: saccharopine dehydrogenase [Frankiaceae bacterium]